MTLRLNIDLPDNLAKQAEEAGLLTSQEVTDWLREELRRRKAAAELKNVLDQIRAQPGEPMSEAEIADEVKAVRRERRVRETGH
jgi:transcriptional regulator GlxA family with amidase domain